METSVNTETAQSGASTARQPAERLKATGRQTASRARDEALSQLQRGKESAAGMASDTSTALDDAAATFSAEGHETLAQAASGLADRLSELGRFIETHTLDELTAEARAVARRNPALFVAGGVALGLALSRFLKASPDADDSGGRS